MESSRIPLSAANFAQLPPSHAHIFLVTMLVMLFFLSELGKSAPKRVGV